MHHSQPLPPRSGGLSIHGEARRSFRMIHTAVIFDMDGVLVDTEPSYFASNNDLFRGLGFSVTTKEYTDFVGSSAITMWSTLKERFRLAQGVAELIDLSYRAHMANLEALPALEPIPGIVTLLNRLTASGVPLGLASSSPRGVIELTLKKSQLTAFFPVRVAGDEVAHGKPHPDIFLKTAALLGVPNAGCLVIEDSPHGIAGARTAGMKTVGLSTANSGNQNLSRADLVVHSFSDAETDRIFRLLESMHLEPNEKIPGIDHR
jgi:HAD superfamily hydrolase (TIGR01509 family)